MILNFIKQCYVFCAKNKIVLILFISIFYTVAMLSAAVFSLWELNQAVNQKIGDLEFDFSQLKRSQTKNQVLYFNILNGKPAATEKEAQKFPAAVVIDNNLAGLSQYGLSEADFIIEMPVEGGITRFLAFFDSKAEISKIGPVRSIRPQMINFAQELGAYTIHAGGSPEALMLLKQIKDIVDIDEIGSDGIYFWRELSSQSPYNLFTNSALLRKALLSSTSPSTVNLTDYSAASWKWESFGGDSFGEDSAVKIADLALIDENIIINYSTAAYKVIYKYNTKEGYYVRYQGGQIHQTGDSDKLTADNVLIAYMPVEVLDKEGRLKINIIGQGKAIICKRGLCLEGVWKKSGEQARIKFYDEEEREVVLKPGKTWMNIVPVGKRVMIEK